MTLAEIEPIDKFKKYIQTDKKVGYYKKTNGYSDKSYEYKLALISDKLVSDIEKLGVVERKTLTLTFPDLREDLIPHFIRGYFDGDGSVFLHTRKSGDGIHECECLGINICGTKEFLITLSTHLPFIDEG